MPQALEWGAPAPAPAPDPEPDPKPDPEEEGPEAEEDDPDGEAAAEEGPCEVKAAIGGSFGNTEIAVAEAMITRSPQQIKHLCYPTPVVAVLVEATATAPVAAAAAAAVTTTTTKNTSKQIEHSIAAVELIQRKRPSSKGVYPQTAQLRC